MVDTTNFTNLTAVPGSSEKLHLVKRFTPASDETIIYQFTFLVRDAGKLPFTVTVSMGFRDEFLSSQTHRALRSSQPVGIFNKLPSSALKSTGRVWTLPLADPAKPGAVREARGREVHNEGEERAHLFPGLQYKNRMFVFSRGLHGLTRTRDATFTIRVNL